MALGSGRQRYGLEERMHQFFLWMHSPAAAHGTPLIQHVIQRSINGDCGRFGHSRRSRRESSKTRGWSEAEYNAVLVFRCIAGLHIVATEKFPRAVAQLDVERVRESSGLEEMALAAGLTREHSHDISRGLSGAVSTVTGRQGTVRSSRLHVCRKKPRAGDMPTLLPFVG